MSHGNMPTPRASWESFDPSPVRPLGRNVLEWSCEQLAQWLHDRMVDKYGSLAIAGACADAIRAHHVDGQTVALLGPTDWCQLIATVGPRAYAAHVMMQLHGTTTHPAPTAPTPPACPSDAVPLAAGISKGTPLTEGSASLPPPPLPRAAQEVGAAETIAPKPHSAAGPASEGLFEPLLGDRPAACTDAPPPNAGAMGEGPLFVKLTLGNPFGFKVVPRLGQYTVYLGRQRRGAPSKATGVLSQVSEVTLDAATKKRAGITARATHFAFAYPTEEAEEHVEMRDFGAFVYLDSKYKVVQVNLLHSAPTEGSCVLPLSEPFELPAAAWQELKEDYRRMQPVHTTPTSAPIGTQRVGWLEPGDPIVEHNPHGAFVYAGGEVDTYRLVVCSRGLCCGTLRQGQSRSGDFTLMDHFLPSPSGLVCVWARARRVAKRRRTSGRVRGSGGLEENPLPCKQDPIPFNICILNCAKIYCSNERGTFGRLSKPKWTTYYPRNTDICNRCFPLLSK